MQRTQNRSRRTRSRLGPRTPRRRARDRAAGLAPATHLTLPHLDGVRRDYLQEVGEPAAARLAIGLLEAELADPGDWLRSGARPSEFLKRTLLSWIGADIDGAAAAWFDLMFWFGDDVDYFGATYGSIGEPLLAYGSMRLEAVKLGPMCERYAAIDPRLPATVFAGLRCLDRFIRTYAWEDAEVVLEWRRERQMELEYEVQEGYMDPEEAAEWSKELSTEPSQPEALKAKPYSLAQLRRKRSTWRGEGVSDVLDAVIELMALAEKTVVPDYREWIDGLGADTEPPQPSILFVADDNDPIGGCYDEEMENQSQGEGFGPRSVVKLDVENRATLERARQTVRDVLKACELGGRIFNRLPGNGSLAATLMSLDHGPEVLDRVQVRT